MNKIKTKNNNEEHPMITKIQNEKDQLCCLHVQRTIYSKAKKLSSVNIVILLLLVGLSFVSTFLHQNEVIASMNALGIFLTLISVKIRYHKSELIQTAASVQRYFDTLLFSQVLQIPDFDTGNVISYFEISHIASRHNIPISKKYEDLKDWYKNNDDFPPIVQVYICQYQNIEWDNVLRNHFKTLCNIAGTITVALPSIYCLIKSSSFVNWFSLFALLMPLFDYWYSLNKDLKSNIQTNEEMQSQGKEIEKDIDNGSCNDYNSIIQRIKTLQEKINLARENKVLIPDFFYKLNKKKQQEQIDIFVNSLVKKYPHRP